MSAKKIVTMERHRGDVYGALANCYRPPAEDIDDLLQVLEAGLRATSSMATSQAVMMRSELGTKVGVDDLTIEFAKLFVGPYRLLAPPFGSIYLDAKGQIMGESTQEVVSRYRAAGLAMDEKFNNPPDHISAELEFIYALIVEEVHCLQKGHTDQAADCLVRQFEFLETHLGAWIEAFTRQTLRQTELPYFRHLALATRQFIKEELQWLGETVADWRQPPQKSDAAAMGRPAC